MKVTSGWEGHCVKIVQETCVLTSLKKWLYTEEI